MIVAEAFVMVASIHADTKQYSVETWSSEKCRASRGLCCILYWLWTLRGICLVENSGGIETMAILKFHLYSLKMS